MIGTRLHGLIDYAMSALLGGLATSKKLSPAARGVLGAAAGYHAGYSTLTDYEAGLSPRVSMRHHLLLDVLGASGLCAAGLLMRRQTALSRSLLLGFGLAEIALVAASSARPAQGPGQGDGLLNRMLGPDLAPAERTGYPPFDVPKPVADGVFVVDSLMPGLVGRVLPLRMTVIRLPDGSLLLHSPTRYGLRLKQALDAIGPVRHLVAPNVAHWIFLRDWQRACPDATTWAAPGLRERGQVRRSGIRLDQDLIGAAPAEWNDAVGLTTVTGGLGFREVALFHRSSRTLLLTDLVLNLEPPKVPAPLRPVARLFGITAPDGMPPPYLRAAIKLRRAEAARAAAELLALAPERVIFAHGRWFDRDGTAALARSLRWLLSA